MDNLTKLSSFSNQKTQGIRDEPISIYVPEQFLDIDNQPIKYPAIVYSILAVNSSDEDLRVSCFIIDNTETANELNRTYLIHNLFIQSGQNFEIVKNHIFLTPNDSIVAACESPNQICDFTVSFSYIFQ